MHDGGTLHGSESRAARSLRTIGLVTHPVRRDDILRDVASWANDGDDIQVDGVRRDEMADGGGVVAGWRTYDSLLVRLDWVPFGADTCRGGDR